MNQFLYYRPRKFICIHFSVLLKLYPLPFPDPSSSLVKFSDCYHTASSAWKNFTSHARGILHLPILKYTLNLTFFFSPEEKKTKTHILLVPIRIVVLVKVFLCILQVLLPYMLLDYM